MKTIKGPGIFLAQFASDKAPFNSLDGLIRWAANLGFKGVQIPTWDQRLFDLERAAESQDYCEEVLGLASQAGLAITELSTHLQGQLVATHPAYDAAFADFAPAALKQDAKGRQAWAVQQLLWAAKASQRLGLAAHASFSGALAWPFFYPWPQRPAGLIQEAFAELGCRWLPFWMPSKRRAWTCASNCIPVRISTMGQPLSAVSGSRQLILQHLRPAPRLLPWPIPGSTSTRSSCGSTRP